MQDFNVHLAFARKWVKPNVHVLSLGSTVRDKHEDGPKLLPIPENYPSYLYSAAERSRVLRRIFRSLEQSSAFSH
jgi:hypothetical protein